MKKIRIGFIRCEKCFRQVKAKNLSRHLKDRCIALKRKEIIKNRPLFTSKEYQEIYLKSEHWCKIKERFYSLFKSCQLCNKRGKLNIHHLTYKRIGKEKTTDLIVLCEDCHINKVHKKLIHHAQLKTITKSYWELAVGSISQPI